ncbi:uncharacterized protein LOC142804383 [Rhipicephalus microplus]|uniref:uncharacterized protein LOC142804383 n=1 Tax=Rhipicephalus microplus TaxID=6941 RepID=UPI003F6B8E36
MDLRPGGLLRGRLHPPQQPETIVARTPTRHPGRFILGRPRLTRISVVNVKDKIKTLRDYFVKEMKKEESSRTSSCLYVSRWEHYKRWEFLRGTVSVETSSQPSIPYPEVKPADEVPGVYLVYQRNSCQNDRIPPSTPDTSDEEGSPRKRPACQHYSTSNGSPLALRSECTALSRDPIVSPFVNGSLTASLLPLPTKRLRQSTVPERISPRQSNHADGSSHTCETTSLSNTASSSRVTGTSSNAEAGNRTSSSSRSSEVVHLIAIDLTEGEALFCKQLTSELREMPKYLQDLAKVRIQQVLFDVKYMGQEHIAGSPEELQRTQPPGVATVPHLGQRAASLPEVYSRGSSLSFKKTRHPAFERTISSV